MVMRKLVFALLGILFLLSYSSCGEDLTRTVKVYN